MQRKKKKKVFKVKGTSAVIKKSSDEFMFIERRIITGLVVSTDYIQQVKPIWDPKLIGSNAARKIAEWCLDYFDKYNKAPGKEIESIFINRTKNLEEDFVNDLEDLLKGLSADYEREDKFNVQYLVDQTNEYFQEQNLDNFIKDLKSEIDEGELDKAKVLIRNFKDVMRVRSNDLDLSTKEAINVLERAFNEEKRNVIKLVRQLGDFLNGQLVRGGFVAFQGPEKRGKTWILIGLAMIAVLQRSNVAFFQAGDMTEEDFLMRIAIYLTKRSNKEKYTGPMWQPVRDCIFNQFDECDLDERECDFGLFEIKQDSEDSQSKFLNRARSMVRDMTLDDLVTAYKDNKGYKACHNCSKYWMNNWGATWIKRVHVRNKLTLSQATQAVTKFFKEHNRRFKLATYSNGTLTFDEVYNKLDIWEKEDGFVPDVIFLDYIDIMDSGIKSDVRHQENEKWKRARALSQDKHALVLTGTQADAKSYDSDRVDVRNFSEDKRKYGHVTAMYGLSMDKMGREKKKGIMRINQIVVREEDFQKGNEVYILQNLKRGQPFLASYF